VRFVIETAAIGNVIGISNADAGRRKELRRQRDPTFSEEALFDYFFFYLSNLQLRCGLAYQPILSQSSHSKRVLLAPGARFTNC
jgi:hypothetical protein